MESAYTVIKSFKAVTDNGIMLFNPGQTLSVPKEKAQLLLKKGKIQPDTCGMITEAIEKTEKIYIPGALAWAKREKPGMYEKMMKTEKKINAEAREKKLTALQRSLTEYRETIKIIVSKYQYCPSTNNKIYENQQK